MIDENDQDPAVVVTAGLAVHVGVVFMTVEQARALREPGALFERVPTNRVLICDDSDAIARLLKAVAGDLDQCPDLGEPRLDNLTIDEPAVTLLSRTKRVMPSISGYSPYGPAHHRRWPRQRSNRPHTRNR